MRSDTFMPTLAALKDQAKRLKTKFASDGETINHARALELIASQYGFKDWNTLHAAAGNRTGIEHLKPGMTVSGSYLGQPFKAQLLGITMSTAAAERYRVVLDLEEAVDVVTFDSFSAFRKRIHGTIGADGLSRERTSNGLPQLELFW